MTMLCIMRVESKYKTNTREKYIRIYIRTNHNYNTMYEVRMRSPYHEGELYREMFNINFNGIFLLCMKKTFLYERMYTKESDDAD